MTLTCFLFSFKYLSTVKPVKKKKKKTFTAVLSKLSDMVYWQDIFPMCYIIIYDPKKYSLNIHSDSLVSVFNGMWVI